MDDPTKQMETDIQRLASAAIRPTVVSSAPTPLGAAVVAKRLETLIKQAGDLHKSAQVVATALVGGSPAQPDRPQTEPRPEHLFGKQMAALDELAAVLDSVHREIERARRALA